MGFLQRLAAKGELKVISQFEAEMHEHAPRIPVQKVQVPCHIIDERHIALGVTMAGESMGIYRCQGRFWAAPLTQRELWQATVDARTFDPEAAAQTMSNRRQDLGPLLPGGTMSVVMGLVAASGATDSSDSPAAQTQESPATNTGSVEYRGDRDDDDDDDDKYARYWDGVVDWYERGFPASREGQLTAEFGVTAQSVDLEEAPVLFDANSSYGIELYGGDEELATHVYLRADMSRSPGVWTILLRKDAEVLDRVIDIASDNLGSWDVTSIEEPTGTVPARVQLALQRLMQLAEDDLSWAFRGAQGTWSAIILDTEMGIEVLRAYDSDDPPGADRPILPNAAPIVERLKSQPRLYPDQREYLDAWDGQ